MPPTELQTVPANEAVALPCAQCAAVVAPALLACPKCHALVHRTELEALANGAEQASARGDIADALAAWRRALLLLPSESKQHQSISREIRKLRAQLDDGAPPNASPGASEPPHARASEPSENGRSTRLKRWGAGLSSALAFAALKLKALWLLLLTGWKPLLFGLTKLGTLSSMLLSLGVYWGLYGWRFALGLVLCIYVHEIGHVVALKRLGIAASSPMFIPGFGAVVRLQQYPIDVDEDAQVGIAGPRWGLGVSAFVFVLSLLTHSPALKAIAHFSAYINLFNLIPIPPLDGGRAFRALGNGQRFACGVALGLLYALTHQCFAGFIALLAFFRGFEKRPGATQNTRMLIEYVGIATLLCLITYAS
jgi:Zn-dependent protease